VNFYNDICKDACEWTGELIKAGLVPGGIVSSAPIQEIKPHEIRGFSQCHFFVGISGWPLAFQLAGVSPTDNFDSGSFPCQPFSGTGKQLGFADPRHLWPTGRRLINQRHPAKFFGEQVGSKLGREWLSRVFSDLAYMGYAGSAADLCSAGVGSPNIRQRLYWVGDACGERFNGQHPLLRAEESRRNAGDILETARGGVVNGLAQSHSHPSEQGPAINGGGVERSGARQEPGLGGSGGVVRLGHADHARREGRLIRWDSGDERAAGPAGLGMWSTADLIYCRDEKWRRIEPGSFPLVDGIPSRVGPLLTELRKLGKRSVALARANRNIRLKGYGNAINPWVAARFIAAHRGGNLVEEESW
jgi:DNA (cytosine-5)-methyltransferase 1